MGTSTFCSGVMSSLFLEYELERQVEMPNKTKPSKNETDPLGKQLQLQHCAPLRACDARHSDKHVDQLTQQRPPEL